MVKNKNKLSYEALSKQCNVCKDNAPEGISLYSVPTAGMKRRKVWCNFVGISVSYHLIHLCAVHFTEDSFAVTRCGRQKRFLLPNAIPTIWGPYAPVATPVAAPITADSPVADDSAAAESVNSVAPSPMPAARPMPASRPAVNSLVPDGRRKVKRDMRVGTEKQVRRKFNKLYNENDRLRDQIADLEAKFRPVWSAEGKELLSEIILSEREGELGDQIKIFATTLNYYSPIAYDYVRKKLCNVLPDQSTINKWYRKVECDFLDFPEDGLNAIEEKVAEKDTFTSCSCMISLSTEDRSSEELSKISPSHDKPPNTEVFTIMATEINDGWKIPLGHFTHLTEDQKKHLMDQCIIKLRRMKAQVPHITFKQSYEQLTGEINFPKDGLATIDNNVRRLQKVFANSYSCKVLLTTQVATIQETPEFNRIIYRSFKHLPENEDLFIIMATDVNGRWRVPAAYFPYRNLTYSQRTHLIDQCVILLKDLGAKTFKIIRNETPPRQMDPKPAEFVDVNLVLKTEECTDEQDFNMDSIDYGEDQELHNPLDDDPLNSEYGEEDEESQNPLGDDPLNSECGEEVQELHNPLGDDPLNSECQSSPLEIETAGILSEIKIEPNMDIDRPSSPLGIKILELSSLVKIEPDMDT